MNKVILIGRLTADPEIRQTQNGTSVSRYRLAVDRPKKQDGEQETDFLSCVCFGKSADFAQKHLHKGMKIAVEGRIQTGSYDKDGVKHYTTDIVVDRHEFCESRQAASVTAAPAPAYAPAPAPDVAYTSAAADDFAIVDDNTDLPF
nr:MAG TPA: Single strand binding protein [Bacteriophage sp.]